MDCQQIIDIYNQSCVKVCDENLFLGANIAILMQNKHANCMKSMELLNIYCKKYMPNNRETGN